ncbi:RNA polymerase sigma factor [Flavobacterium sp.]|uniref:RNA polymerase sigma factor n=1 Tax=Flavobacterium sp. TaxID=239 RepID=UPI0026061D1B|nr:RNA polymerase sigma factor [Flavobacterium sp.]
MFRLAKRLLVSTEEAEDATQEVLMKLWTKGDSLQQLGSVEAFAMTLTKNYCLDQLKAKRSSNVALEHHYFEDASQQTLRKVEAEDRLAIVEKLMAQLPEQQRLILQLREVEEYEFAEIAKVMEMNETAVRVALSRARKQLREQMLKLDQYGISRN